MTIKAILATSSPTMCHYLLLNNKYNGHLFFLSFTLHAPIIITRSDTTLYWTTDGWRLLAEVLGGVEDGRVGEGPVEPPPGDVAVGCLGEVDAVPAPVVGGVVAGVRPRLAALGRQVEVVLAHARRPAARPRLLLQEP